MILTSKRLGASASSINLIQCSFSLAVSLLPPILHFPLSLIIPHPQNLHHPYENVQKVEFQTDALVHRIPLD